MSDVTDPRLPLEPQPQTRAGHPSEPPASVSPVAEPCVAEPSAAETSAAETPAVEPSAQIPPAAAAAEAEPVVAAADARRTTELRGNEGRGAGRVLAAIGFLLLAGACAWLFARGRADEVRLQRLEATLADARTGDPAR